MANLLPNPGAETNATGWTPTAGVLDRVTVPVRTGAGAFRLTAPATPPGDGVISVLAADLTSGFTAGQQVVVSVHVRSAALARPVSLKVDWKPAGGGYLGTAGPEQITTTTTGWTQTTATLTVPSEGGRATVYVRFAGITDPSEVHYIDDVVFDPQAAGGDGTTRPPQIVLSALAASIWPDPIVAAITGEGYSSLSTALTTKPADSAATVTGATTTTPTVTPDKLGTYTLTTTATGFGGTATATRSTVVYAQEYQRTATGSVPVAEFIKTAAGS